MRWLFDRPHDPAPAAVKVLLGLLGAVAFAGACVFFLAGSTTRWDAVWGYRGVFLQGWWLTVQLSFVALLASVFVGVAAALARRSAFLPLRGLAVGYIEVVRGTPLLVLLFFLYYVVAYKFHWEDRTSVGVVVLSLFSGAYIAEIVRSGIESVGASQLESARAIGLTAAQTYRFVIFPQALRHCLPPLAGQFASIIKDSSLLSVIGIAEFTYAAQQINSATYSTLESFLPLGIGYLVLTIPVSFLAKIFERRLQFVT